MGKCRPAGGSSVPQTQQPPAGVISWPALHRQEAPELSAPAASLRSQAGLKLSSPLVAGSASSPLAYRCSGGLGKYASTGAICTWGHIFLACNFLPFFHHVRAISSLHPKFYQDSELIGWSGSALATRRAPQEYQDATSPLWSDPHEHMESSGWNAGWAVLQGCGESSRFRARENGAEGF